MDHPEPHDLTPSSVANRSRRAARVVLGLVLVALGVWTIRHYVPALAWGAVLAVATWPLYQRAQHRWPPGRGNIVVPALFTVAVALVLIVPVGVVALQVGREAHSVAAWVRDARTTGVSVPDWVGGLPLVGTTAAEWWQAHLADPNAPGAFLGQFDQGQVVAVSRLLGSLVLDRAMVFVFTLLTLFFLFRDGRHVTQQMLVASRRAFGPSGERIGRQIVASIRGTVNGLVLVGLGEGVALGIAYLALGVPRPTLFGAFTAIAAMIPFGAPLAFGVASLLLLGRGETTGGIALFAFGMFVVFVSDHAVRPILIGGATRLPFLWVLLGILGGVETWGLLGLFFGPAIMAALILLWREWTEDAAAA